MRLWVLIFNTGSDTEGIYTLLVGGKNTVVAFADEDDAIRYSGLLEAQDFLCPTVEQIDEQEIVEFCEGAGYELSVVQSGELAIPPEQNVEKTDWSPDGDEEENVPAIEDSAIEMMRRRLEGLL
ncbi:DUF3110 domain-containing protein [Tumidithrix helvetica PCC 7403]|uniref:DUF3110 domain-containing protein n=1 Tax=Tumidithrix helvetica TaxID=3457545 RepID=UPI003C95300D